MSEEQEILYRRSPLNGNTLTIGTLGYPVQNTISPEFQGAAFEATGTNMVYLPFNVKPEDIGDAVQAIRALGLKGTNVTMPHKQTCMKYLDELDPMAEVIGSVNGIVNTDGKLKGYSFEMTGFMHPFEGMDLKGKRIVQIGAGGGGRAAAFGLAQRGADMVILNRNQAKAETLAEKLENFSGNKARGEALTPVSLEREMAEAEIVVHATNVGFDKLENETLIPQELFRPGMIVYDIVYSPLETRLQKEAKARGAKTIGGLEMIVGQGALFFEAVTGKKAPYDLMLETGRKVLLARAAKKN